MASSFISSATDNHSTHTDRLVSRTPPNPPLTPAGVAQARQLAQRVAPLPIDRLFTSQMREAVETALAVSGEIARPVEVWSKCYEYRSQPGYWSWGAGELRARYPSLRLPDDFAEDDWYFRGEALNQAFARANAVLGWLREESGRSRTRRFVVAAHGAYTRIILSILMSSDVAALDRMLELDHTALTTLSLTAEAIRVVGVNDTAHLASLPELDPLLGITR